MHYLFDKIKEIRALLKNKYLFILLDYDGTLAPIVNSPEKAALPGKTRELLVRLAESLRCKVAVISGRALSDIKARLGLKGIIYSGNHGLEIEGPKIRFITPIPAGYQKLIQRIKKDLIQRISSINGAFIEDKGLSLTLHFRRVKKKDVDLLKTIFHETVIFDLVSNKIKIKAGKKVLEVRPIVEWDKGKVVLWLLARQKFAKAGSNVLAVYIGDDLTDEDVFKALENIGLTVFVGRPGYSRAQYYLKNTAEVGDFLRIVIDLLEKD
ncbi:MAG: trehalose-phosphatase [Candidatus Omnitrophota bacterium]